MEVNIQNIFPPFIIIMSVSEISNIASMFGMLCIANPLELIKTRMQTCKELVLAGKIKNPYTGALDCVRNIFQKEGIRCFWKGNGLSMCRFYPNESINFFVKTNLQRQLPQHAGFNCITGVIGGWAATTVLYPFDTLRLLVSNTIGNGQSVFSIIRQTIERNGKLFFYKGFSNSLVSTALFRGSFNGAYAALKPYSLSTEMKWGFAYLSTLFAAMVCYPLESVRRRRITKNCTKTFLDFAGSVVKEEGTRGLYKGFSMVYLQSIAGSFILYWFQNRATQANQ